MRVIERSENQHKKTKMNNLGKLHVEYGTEDGRVVLENMFSIMHFSVQLNQMPAAYITLIEHLKLIIYEHC